MDIKLLIERGGAKLVKNLGKSNDLNWKGFVYKVYKSPTTGYRFLAVFDPHGKLKKTWMNTDSGYKRKHSTVIGKDSLPDAQKKQMSIDMGRMHPNKWYSKWKDYIIIRKVPNVPLDIRKKFDKLIGEQDMRTHEIRRVIREELLKEFFHPKDSLLREITFEDLITAVESNESTINEQSVKKVFEEMLRDNIIDARSELKSNMKKILKLIG